MGFNPLYTNTCEGANQNPFDPANWTIYLAQIPSLLILNKQLIGGTNAQDYVYGENYYSGPKDLTSDCFAQYQIASIPAPSPSVNSTIYCSLRSVAADGYNSGYYMLVWQAGDTPLLLVVNPSETFIISKTLSNISVGDTFALSAVGSTITAYHNGTVVASVTDTTTDRDGTTFVLIQWTVSQSDTGIVNLEIGSVTTTYSISGNAGVAGALLTLSGAGSGTTTADGSGNYSFTGLVNGAYTITPSKSGYNFAPTSANETVSNANITGVNFVASVAPPAYIIEEWMYRTGFTEQVDGVNDINLPMPYRVGFAALVKMQVTYSIYLHNRGANTPGQPNVNHIWKNFNSQWQQVMVARQQAQTTGFAAIYASAPLLPNPTPPFVYPTY